MVELYSIAYYILIAAVLIIVMSVMNGFRTELINKIVGFNSHITVQPYEQAIKINDVKIKSKEGLSTIPSTIKEELECNVFLRSHDVETFSKLRDLKVNF